MTTHAAVTWDDRLQWAATLIRVLNNYQERHIVGSPGSATLLLYLPHCTVQPAVRLLCDTSAPPQAATLTQYQRLQHLMLKKLEQ